MTKALLGAVLTCCLLLGPGCRKKTADAQQTPRDACLDNCQLRSKQLGCKGPRTCEANCKKVAEASVCKKPLDAFMACAIQQKQSDWECSDGVPVLVGHTCEEEGETMQACLQHSRGKL